ncbi:MAG: dihydrofolate reductase [Desulfobulbaceae bacterium]|nr:MAG: dihydrofolate reductase [Desulfobulbaceae bacterium]
MPEYIIIVAVAQNGVIGREGTLPWHLPTDLKHFKKTTMNFPLIMGRKTYESIGKPLPNRENIVLTRDETKNYAGCIMKRTIKDALDYCAEEAKVFIIGGADIFRETLPFTDTLIVTELQRAVEGDVYFPEINTSEFNLIDSTDYDVEERFTIKRYERVSP